MFEMPDEVVFTVPEAAQILRVSPNTLRRGIEREEVPVIRVGRRMLIPRPALERLLGLQAEPRWVESEEDAALALFEARRRLWTLRRDNR
jgi:excisionase family DNA binding protein